MSTTYERPTILYVDDEERALKYFARGVGRDFNVITAANTDEAREILQQRSDEIAILLTDQRMPRGDGVSLLTECKTQYPQIVRLLTTAYADIDEAIAAVNHGEVWRYITKPWDLQALRGELEDALEVYRQQRWEQAMLGERYRTLTAVAGHMAHEMRTPLLSIRSAASALERYLPALAEGHRQAVEAELPVPEIRRHRREALVEAVASIQRVVDRANAVIDLLLVNSGSRRLDPSAFERCSMAECLRAALHDFPFEPDMRERVSVEDGADFQFRGAPELIVFVVHNLLRNALRAVRAANRGGVRLWLTRGERHNGLHVEDDGVGIDPEVRPRIFNDFERFSGDDSGVGIGLAFCRRVMDSIGGHIDCDSEPGTFTRFDLWFPAGDGHEQAEDSDRQ